MHVSHLMGGQEVNELVPAKCLEHSLQLVLSGWIKHYQFQVSLSSLSPGKMLRHFSPLTDCGCSVDGCVWVGGYSGVEGGVDTGKK